MSEETINSKTEQETEEKVPETKSDGTGTVQEEAVPGETGGVPTEISAGEAVQEEVSGAAEIPEAAAPGEADADDAKTKNTAAAPSESENTAAAPSETEKTAADGTPAAEKALKEPAGEKAPSEAGKNAIYAKAREKMKEDRLESYREAVSLFSHIPGWKDSDLQATRCFHRISQIKSNKRKKIKEIAKDSIIIVITAIFMGLIFKSIIPGIEYNSAVIMMEEGNYEGAEGVLRTLGDYSDSAEKLELCEALIREENYQEACKAAEAEDYKKAKKLFEELGGYKDSAVQAAEIMELLYSRAAGLRSSGSLQEALEAFNELDGYLDSEEQMEEIRAEILEETGEEAVIRPDDTEEEEETVPEEPEQTEEEKKQDKLELILIILAAALLIFVLAGIPLYFRVLKPYLAYRRACRFMDAGSYEEAITIFRDLEDYKDSRSKVKECEKAILDRRYEAACQRMDAGEYEEAILAFTALNGYRDSLEMIQKCRNAILDIAYQAAMQLKEETRFPEAVEAFRALKGYRDSGFQASLCSIAIKKEPVYQEACELMEKDFRKEALALFGELRGYRDAAEKIKKIKTLYYKDALSLMKEKHYPEAISAFTALEGFKDSSQKIMECRQLILDGKYQEAKFLMGQEEYESAIDIFRGLRAYEDSPELLVKCRKAIRAPRPFNHLIVGMTVDEAVEVFGEPVADRKNRKTGYRELVFGGSRLMDAVGYLTLEFEKKQMVRAVWSADFCWEPYERENEGLFPGIEYARYRDYYTFLFGECTSEYVKDNHKGSWWRNPELTVDVSGYDYVTIHFSFQKPEGKK